MKRGREVNSTPPLRQPSSVSSPCSSRRRDQDTKGRACESTGLVAALGVGVGKGEVGIRAGTDLDFVKAQPLGETDQLLRLLHAPHLSAATLNDLGLGESCHPSPRTLPLLPPTLCPPLSLTPPDPSIPAAYLADSTQGFLSILLAAGPLLCLAQNILGTRRSFS